MADSVLKYIYAVAISSVCIRADYIGYSGRKRDLCRSLSAGFDLGEINGDNFFTNKVENVDFSGVTGFNDLSYYKTYEDTVKSILSSDSKTSGLNDNQKTLLASIVNGILYGTGINQSAILEDISYVIGKSLQDTGLRIFGLTIYDLDQKENIIHPFTAEVIEDLITQNNYNNISTEVSGSPKSKEIDLVHYNWYDLTRVFSGPNLDMMKSAENQYYYLSGQLTYPQSLGLENFCIESGIQIATEAGVINTSFITNQPCVDKNSYIGPVNNTKFYREFNDGPYSSGNFTSSTKESFINFDKEKLIQEEYSENRAKLYTFAYDSTGAAIPLTLSKTNYDINGEYSFDEEYKYAPLDTGCFPKYQVMRVGNSGIRSQCVAYDGPNCISCIETGTTGFKFALLELGTGHSGDYAYILSNPFNSGFRTLKRGLNFSKNAYKSEISEGLLNTYQLDTNNNPIWYFGPPQISGQDSLPFFAFTNDFQSNLATKNAKVVLYPAFGSANGTSRSYSVSKTPIASGEDISSYSIESIYLDELTPKAKFYQIINPYNSGDDEIKAKLFGMGNNFSGLYNFAPTLQENAGYFYTGYVYSGTTLESLTPTFATIGSSFTGVKFITGYQNIATKEVLGQSKLYANDGSGKNIEYYFYDNRLLPITVTNTGNWTTFSPLPSGLENNSNYERVYAVQKNENNFPRYYNGPYSSLEKKFLYPNASRKSDEFGFPTKYKYKIEVREETVKEYFTKYSIQAGAVYGPEYIPVVRPNFDENYSTAMVDIFDSASFDLNDNQVNTGYFNNGGISGVRENWAKGSPPVPSLSVGPASAFQIPSLFDSNVFGSFSISPPSTLSIDSFLIIDPSINYLYNGYAFMKDEPLLSYALTRNGIYTLEKLSTNTYKWNQTSLGLENTNVLVTEGAVYKNTIWNQTTPNPVVGVSVIVFVEGEVSSSPENSNGFNLTIPNKYVTENLYKENANFNQGILTETVNFDFQSGAAKITPLINYSNRNLFHGYTGYEISGELTYTPPAFNLSKGQIDKSFAQSSIDLISTGCYSYFQVGSPSNVPSLSNGVAELYIKNLNGEIAYSKSGQDPVYQEYLGGRVGFNAENEGGRHSKQMVGDSWMGLNFRDYGYYCVNNGNGECYDMSRTGIWNPDATVNSNRVPKNDDHWFLIDLKPSGVKIHTRALDYNPMSFNYPNQPFDINSTSPIVSFNGSESQMTFLESGQMFVINLNSYLPATSSTGYNYFYNNRSGFYIGPFDRDVEIFAIEPLSGHTEFYINNRLVADTINGTDNLTDQCVAPKVVSGEFYSSVFTNGTLYSTGNFQNIKNITYIPNGEKCYIDLKNNYDTNLYDIANDLLIGFPENSFLYIRARKTLNNNVFNANPVASADFIKKFLSVSGSDFWLNNHNMMNNGMESVYEINEDIENLKDNSYTFLSFSRTGKMYPTPLSDFANHLGTNSDGTKYLTIAGVEEYWQLKSLAQTAPIHFSGWREGSRISFKFTELEPVLGEIPYESLKVITPSGNCILSGEMGYLGQADKSIFSEGVYLKDATLKDGIRDNIYGPNYVSDVLTRLPVFPYPSGTFINPVVSAPSVMKQRKNRFNINPETITYSGINTKAPYNYNKLLWPALSDLKTLNPDETIEAIPPDDGNTFTNSTMLISASQGQKLPNGQLNPDTRKVYQIGAQFQTYDSVATDSSIDVRFTTSGFGFLTELRQSEEGVLVPLGTTLNDINLGLI